MNSDTYRCPSAGNITTPPADVNQRVGRAYRNAQEARRSLGSFIEDIFDQQGCTPLIRPWPGAQRPDDSFHQVRNRILLKE